MWEYVCFIIIVFVAVLLRLSWSAAKVGGGGGSDVGEPTSGAFAIITPDGVVEQYKRGTNPRTLFQQASISKSVAALLVAILVEREVLAWKDPADKYLQRWKIGDNAVTIERLLSHTSGLAKPPGGGSNGYPLDVVPPTAEAIARDEQRWVPMPKHLQKMSAANRLGLEIRGVSKPPNVGLEMRVRPGVEFPLSEAVSSVPMFRETALKRLDEDDSIRLEDRPGSKWQYVNHNYLLIQMLVEDATDRTFADLCHQYIFRPLGMMDSSFILETLDRSRIAKPHWKDGDVPVGLLRYRSLAAGGLYSTLPDMVKFCRELIEPTLVKAATMKRLLSPMPNSPDYGLGFMLEADGWIGHRGSNTGWKAHYLVNPAKKRGIMYMSNYQGHPYADWLYGEAGIHGYFQS